MNIYLLKILIFDLIDLFFHDGAGVIIEVPSDLIIEEVNLQTKNGNILVTGVETSKLALGTSNGNITVSDSLISFQMDATTSNGNLTFRNLTGASSLEAVTELGNINMNNVEFTIVELHSELGNITLDNLCLAQDGIALIAQT